MLTDRSCGIIPVLVRDGQRRYLLVRHGRGHWGFPKGHPEAGETPVQTALRELAEETGITELTLLETPVLHEQYIFRKKTGQLVRKDVTYYLGLIEDETVTPRPGEISACAWGDVEATRELLTFPESRRLLDAAEAHLGNDE